MNGFKPRGWSGESRERIHQGYRKLERRSKRGGKDIRILRCEGELKRGMMYNGDSVGASGFGRIGKRCRWERFKAFVFPWLRQSKDLGEAYVKARIAREENEARKIAEEAAEIAARKDVTSQKEVKTFNAIIDDIFADDTLPPGAKGLKLAKLIEKNPQVAKQLENVKDIIEKLSLKKGFNIEVVEDSQKSLPEGEQIKSNSAEGEDVRKDV